MPREFLALGRKRESRERAERFPRTSARVMAGPPCDRMIHTGESGTRREAKRALRELVDAGHLEHLRD